MFWGSNPPDFAMAILECKTVITMGLWLTVDKIIIDFLNKCYI